MRSVGSYFVSVGGRGHRRVPGVVERAEFGPAGIGHGPGGPIGRTRSGSSSTGCRADPFVKAPQYEGVASSQGWRSARAVLCSTRGDRRFCYSEATKVVSGTSGTNGQSRSPTSCTTTIWMNYETRVGEFQRSSQRTGHYDRATPSDEPLEFAEQRELHEALLDGYEAINSHFEDAFGDLMDLLMVQVRKPLTVRQFADAVGALVEGCSLRDRVTEGMANIMRATGPDGQMQEWTTFSIGLVALATEFFEPIPSTGP